MYRLQVSLRGIEDQYDLFISDEEKLRISKALNKKLKFFTMKNAKINVLDIVTKRLLTFKKTQIEKISFTKLPESTAYGVPEKDVREDILDVNYKQLYDNRLSELITARIPLIDAEQLATNELNELSKDLPIAPGDVVTITTECVNRVRSYTGKVLSCTYSGKKSPLEVSKALAPFLQEGFDIVLQQKQRLKRIYRKDILNIKKLKGVLR